MDMTRKGLILLLLAAGLALPLAGCRVRTTGGGQAATVGEAVGPATGAAQGEIPSDDALDSAVPGEADARTADEPGGRTRENPDAARKEFDESAPAEIVPGTERSLHGEGEGGGAPLADDGAEAGVARLNERAAEPAAQTVAAQEADKTGVSEDAEAADSAMTYFTVLLEDRLGSLFECQRANVYWETSEDHVTVHRTSPEHGLILSAGAYDVSARLLPENLRVDDGWVARKNPGVIVKVVESGVLGGGVASTGAARAVWQALVGREGWAAVDAVRGGRVLLLSRELLDAPYLQTAALLMIAKTANADLFADVDPGQALRMLAEEATGTLPTGVFWYTGKDE